MGNFQMWLAIGVLFLFIGIPQLVNQGIGEGKPLGIVAGLVFLAGAGLSFYQAYAEKRRADEKKQADLSSADATEAPPSPDQPQ